MLSQRLSLILYSARTLTLNPLRANEPEKTIEVAKDKYRNYHKEGPQLQVTKILMKNGALTSKQIWRSYQFQLQDKRKAKQQYSGYWNSLSQLKKTLGYMRTNGKIKGSGYDKRKRMFLGWKLQQKTALKYVHPEVIEELQAFLKSKNEL